MPTKSRKSAKSKKVRRPTQTRRTVRLPEKGAPIAIGRPATGSVRPLDPVDLFGTQCGTVVVTDANGREYFRGPAAPKVTFLAGGALGTHVVEVLGPRGKAVQSLTFDMSARTAVDDDGGRYHDLLEITYRTMCCYSPTGMSSLAWRKRAYRFYVHWILDHSHTAKGMQFFADANGDLVDLLRQVQRDDGMIWSNVNVDPGPGYFDSAYGPDGYAVRRDGLLLIRQPVENHCEYNFVDAVHLAWKAGGDDAWMKRNLNAAMRALDYSAIDPARWSAKHGLLKRGYTIDSWDFQVDDEYSVKMNLATSQRIDNERTKFGVFCGDNTGYAYACAQLAEMLRHAGRDKQSEVYGRRCDEVLERLTNLAWNGRFFRHRVEEDPAVRRDLGVDESAQIVMSNAYSLNRGIPHDQCVAILKTYEHLRRNLPDGSPGEWYAIYPPFGRGFGRDNDTWQYMNGGVHGHAAGELARGAFEHGFERYGADILSRLRDLGNRHGGTIKFAYTGASTPPPPAQVFEPIDLSAVATMDLWDKGAEGVPRWMTDADPGNDMRNLPVGAHELAGVPFLIADPQTNGRRTAVAVSRSDAIARSAEIPIVKKAGAIYLLHAAGALGPSGIAAALTFCYNDRSEHTLYIRNGTHLAGWWFPSLKASDAGVAWRGPNPRSNDVGVYWAAIPNPHPEKSIDRIVLGASAEGAKYAVVGLTLADRMPYHTVDPVSFGGPDNWSGGTVALALVEGLAGVKDVATAYREVRLSPRWAAAGVDRVDVTVKYGASNGYIAYQYRHDPAKRTICLTLTGSGDGGVLRVLLPAKARGVVSVLLDGTRMVTNEEKVESSRYAVLPLGRLAAPTEVLITYKH